jgi:hypothetical protein
MENEINNINLEELEEKNKDELESLERLIILFEDIKNIEYSNLNYAKELLKDVQFKDFLLIGKLGNLCKAYFQSYYETKLKLIQNLKKIIIIMKLKSINNINNENNDFIISNDSRNTSNVSESISKQNYIGKKDIFEIINSISLINDLNNENKDNYEKIIGKEIENITKMENVNHLNILKEIKEEKIIFENRLKDICDKGTDSEELNIVKNSFLNDNSNEQKYIIWCVNYLNKYRAKLSVVKEKVYDAFKILFDIIFNKLIEKKLYGTLDLAIILIQTFSKRIDEENLLLEEEFKNNKIFQSSDIWVNLIMEKTKELFDKTNEENSNNEYQNNIDNFNYIKENIVSILIGYIFSMKDFNINDKDIRKVIEEICNKEEFIKFNFNIDILISSAVE